jgi:hypothetical protein
MAAVDMRVDLSSLVDTIANGDTSRIIAAAREHLAQNEDPSVLLGRISMIAAHGDTEGHLVTTLSAAAMLCRYIHFIPLPLDPDSVENPADQEDWSRALPLFARALLVAVPAVRAGHNASPHYPEPYFPSELLDSGKSVRDVMREAVTKGDGSMIERLLFGLYGTGADYRTMQARTYDGIANVFQDDGHPLIYAVRGFQALDAVEWGDLAPNILHWLAPHLALKKTAQELSWVNTVRSFVGDHAEALAGLRKRLAMPKNESALSLRQQVLQGKDTSAVCQAVYDALLPGGASPHAVASAIALAAADILLHIPESDSETFTHASHGLLYAAATRAAIQQTHEADESFPLLFLSAAYVQTLQQEIAGRQGEATQKTAGAEAARKTSPATTMGGGLIKSSQLETLQAQLSEQNYQGALITAQRYLKLNYDPQALFGVVGQVAAQADLTADQGHILQVVHAASEEYISWPRNLDREHIDAFLQVALRAAVYSKRDNLLANL